MSADNPESEQVEVSASKLRWLVMMQQEHKEKHAQEIARLKAYIRGQDEKLKLCDNAIRQLKLGKDTKRAKNGDTAKKMMDEIQKAKQFDDWYEKNKEKLIEDEFNKNFKADVELFKSKLCQMVDG